MVVSMMVIDSFILIKTTKMLVIKMNIKVFIVALKCVKT